MSKSVILSNRAYTSILVETLEKIETETGGVFLGFKKEDVWYIVESVDPGPKSIFLPLYFEYDREYIEHLANKISRIYSKKLDLIGLWHRHPGGYDVFSSQDNITNEKYAKLSKDGAISSLVNIDPDFRLTMYSVEYPLRYEKIHYTIDDSIISSLIGYRNHNKLFNTIYNRNFSLHNYFRELEMDKILNSISKNEERVNNLINKDNEDDLAKDNIEGILEKLEDDLSFLKDIGVAFSLNKTKDNLLEVSFKSERKNPFKINFHYYKGNIYFSYNESYYEYRAGIFKEEIKNLRNNKMGVN